MTTASQIIERLPVDPTTIDVLGHRVKPDNPAWTGLDWTRAELRNRTKIAVPWCHPEDQRGSPDDFDCIYAIYPLATAGKRWRGRLVKDVWFERDGDKWFVAVARAVKRSTNPEEL